MKDILLFIDVEPGRGGAFQYNQTFLKIFDSMKCYGYNKKVLYTNDKWVPYLNEFNFQHYGVNFNRYLRKILSILVLIGIPKKYRYLIFNFLSPSLSEELNSKNIKLLILPTSDMLSYFLNSTRLNVIHDLMHIYEKRFPEVSKMGRFRYRENMFKSFCEDSDIILTDSQYGIEQAKNSYSIVKPLVYSLPYIAPPYLASKKNANITNKFNSLNLPAKYVFYPAQFWQHKNHINLLHAINILKNKGIFINLILTGNKNFEYKNIVKAIRKFKLESQIFILDYITEDIMINLYQNARCMVMPTFFGPTNIPPLEAMLLDCPVAVSNIYGMKEQLKDAALFFDPNCPDSISEQLLILWQDDTVCAELIKKGTKIINNWTVDHAIISFQEIINTFLIKNKDCEK